MEGFLQKLDVFLSKQSTFEQGCQMVYFLPKNPIWVYFGEPWNEKWWYILWPFGIF
jgi:hypothetical protein